MHKKLILIASIATLAFAGVAYAYTPFFGSTAKTNNATSSPTFLVRGTTFATTTSPVYDAFEQNGTNQTNQSAPYPAQSVAFEVQFTASSTVSNLQWYYEYADREDGVNCGTNPTGCDWYTDELISPNRLSTSTIVNFSAGYVQSWTFASSTIGGAAASATNNRDNKIFNVNLPTRYVRAVFFCPSSANCGVWAKWIPIKQGTY